MGKRREEGRGCVSMMSGGERMEGRGGEDILVIFQSSNNQKKPINISLML